MIFWPSLIGGTFCFNSYSSITSSLVFSLHFKGITSIFVAISEADFCIFSSSKTGFVGFLFVYLIAPLLIRDLSKIFFKFLFLIDFIHSITFLTVIYMSAAKFTMKIRPTKYVNI